VCGLWTRQSIGIPFGLALRKIFFSFGVMAYDFCESRSESGGLKKDRNSRPSTTKNIF